MRINTVVYSFPLLRSNRHMIDLEKLIRHLNRYALKSLTRVLLVPSVCMILTTTKHDACEFRRMELGFANSTPRAILYASTIVSFLLRYNFDVPRG